MMGFVIFSRGNFGMILESWSWSKATVIITSSVRTRPLFIYLGQPILQIVFYVFGYAIYNIYFHPLAKFPGPKFAAISNASQNRGLFPPLSDMDLSQIFYARTVVTGTSVKTMKALHDKYGLFPKSSRSCK